jgi:hypothetical protein
MRPSRLGVTMVVALTAVGCLAACGGGPAIEPSATVVPVSSGAAPTPSAAWTPSAAPVPVVEHRTVTETAQIPFVEQTVDDPALAKGTTAVRTNGAAGEKTRTYDVTVTDGVETDRKLAGETVTRQPVAKVTAIGTKEIQPKREPDQPRCDLNYSGCVPIASDVDCAGGSGNGPAFVRGPVRVVGSDIYDLDRDGDGIACE